MDNCGGKQMRVGTKQLRTTRGQLGTASSNTTILGGRGADFGSREISRTTQDSIRVCRR